MEGESRNEQHVKEPYVPEDRDRQYVARYVYDELTLHGKTNYLIFYLPPSSSEGEGEFTRQGIPQSWEILRYVRFEKLGEEEDGRLKLRANVQIPYLQLHDYDPYRDPVERTVDFSFKPTPSASRNNPYRDADLSLPPEPTPKEIFNDNNARTWQTVRWITGSTAAAVILIFTVASMPSDYLNFSTSKPPRKPDEPANSYVGNGIPPVIRSRHDDTSLSGRDDADEEVFTYPLIPDPVEKFPQEPFNQ